MVKVATLGRRKRRPTRPRTQWAWLDAEVGNGSGGVGPLSDFLVEDGRGEFTPDSNLGMMDRLRESIPVLTARQLEVMLAYVEFGVIQAAENLGVGKAYVSEVANTVKRKLTAASRGEPVRRHVNQMRFDA